MIDERTTNRDYPLPHQDNSMRLQDLPRLREALEGVDGDVQQLIQDVAGHDHAGVYAAVAHDHAGSYAVLTHDHAGSYAVLTHDHAGSYAILTHDHAGSYAVLTHDHAGSYADVGHDHAGVYQPADSDLTALAGLTTTGLIERTGDGATSTVTVTAAGKALLDDADAAAQLVTLGAAGQGKQTIPINAAGIWPRTTTGCAALAQLEMATNKGNFPYLAFDSTTAEYAQILVSFPKSWNAGTVTASFIWTHPAATTNFGVTWRISGVAIGNDDAMDVARGSAISVSDTGGTTSDLYLSAETAAVTIAGTPAAGDSVLFEISRNPADGSDTMAVDAYLLGVNIFFTTNAATDA